MVRYLVTRNKTADGECFGIAVQDGQDMVDSIDDVASTLSQTTELAVFLQENGVEVSRTLENTSTYTKLDKVILINPE